VVGRHRDPAGRHRPAHRLISLGGDPRRSHRCTTHPRQRRPGHWLVALVRRPAGQQRRPQTTIAGPVPDQAALLTKVHDLGLQAAADARTAWPTEGTRRAPRWDRQRGALPPPSPREGSGPPRGAPDDRSGSQWPSRRSCPRMAPPGNSPVWTLT
jgi:hypothetical protein